MTKPTTVDEYIAAHDDPAASRLRELRSLCQGAAPETTEALKWGSPAHLHPRGTILFVYSAHKHHVNVTFTPSTREAFEGQLTGFETGKGSVKLPYATEVPTELLRRMIAYRFEEYEQRGVMWM